MIIVSILQSLLALINFQEPNETVILKSDFLANIQYC